MLNIKEQAGKTITEGGVIDNRISLSDKSQKRKITG